MEYLNTTAASEFDQRLKQLIEESEAEIAGWNEIDMTRVEKTASDLDAWDYCFCIAIGIASSFISTNEALQDYLKDIHNAASEADGEYDFLQRFLGMLLHHKGDPIDKIDRNFIKRDRENAWVLFHRLLWGHDVLSFRTDNPFYLMIKKQGLSGIVQTIQHLLADTTSKQGLPFPGSSYFDFRDGEGNLSNYLISIAQQLSIDVTGNKRLAQDIYSHMFTIRAADLIGRSSASVLSDLYFMARTIDDRIRLQQIRFITYSVNFWSQAIIGYIKQKVPYINIPIGKAMIQSFMSLYAEGKARTHELVRKGQALSFETDRLEAIAKSDFSQCKQSKSNSSAEERINQGKENVMRLLQAWKEEE